MTANRFIDFPDFLRVSCTVKLKVVVVLGTLFKGCVFAQSGGLKEIASDN